MFLEINSIKLKTMLCLSYAEFFFDEWISGYICYCQLLTNEYQNIFSFLYFHEWMSGYIRPCSIFTNEYTNISKWKIWTKYHGKWITMDSEDEKEDEDKGNFFNINRWDVELPKVFGITTNIFLNSFIWMYLLESNIPNEYLYIFMRRTKSWMHVQIYSLWKNSWIFKQMNIFVNKYLNIF